MEPPPSVPSLSPAEMQILVSRTGLVLNPGQVADLVLAWRQVAMLINSIPRDRPLIDDMALTFRLPSPLPPPMPPAAGTTVRAKPAKRKPSATLPPRPSASSPGRTKLSVGKKAARAVRPVGPKAEAVPSKPARRAERTRPRAAAGSKPHR
jgi:hypothetical protein